MTDDNNDDDSYDCDEDQDDADDVDGQDCDEDGTGGDDDEEEECDEEEYVFSPQKNAVLTGSGMMTPPQQSPLQSRLLTPLRARLPLSRA